MEKTRTITLLEPVIVAGKERTEITVRRSTVGDEEDAMDMAIKLNRPKNAVTAEICLFSRLAKLPYEIIRNMNGHDYAAMRDALNGLNGVRADDPTRQPETDGTPENASDD